MRTAKRLPAVGLTAALVGAALALAACAHGSNGSSAGIPSVPGLSPASGSTSTYIQHIVIMIQENRSFNDLFATFPGADGATEGLMKTPSGDQYIQLHGCPSRLFEFGASALSVRARVRSRKAGRVQ